MANPEPPDQAPPTVPVPVISADDVLVTPVEVDPDGFRAWLDSLGPDDPVDLEVHPEFQRWITRPGPAA